jgi:hypothetical protein
MQQYSCATTDGLLSCMQGKFIQLMMPGILTGHQGYGDILTTSGKGKAKLGKNTQPGTYAP